nr:hypothetical protein OG781_43945 [Streptomyces sp. NBC_00830]
MVPLVRAGAHFERGLLDWLQRKIVESLDSSDALAVLAESGRTRRLQNTARTTLTRRDNRA